MRWFLLALVLATACNATDPELNQGKRSSSDSTSTTVPPTAPYDGTRG